jgi:hypothetical protein
MHTDLPHESGTFWSRLRDAARFWEPWRAAYNLALGAVVLAWLLATWPHFRPALTLPSLLLLLVLAVLANVCYCAAYPAELLLRISPGRVAWRRFRWRLWLGGTLLAILLACYWIADEMYPAV